MAHEALEEKHDYYAKAKECLMNDNEAEAEHYLQMVQLKENEYQQNLKMVRQYQMMHAAVKQRGDEMGLANDQKEVAQVLHTQIIDANNEMKDLEKKLDENDKARDQLAKMRENEEELVIDHLDEEFINGLDKMHEQGEIDQDQKDFVKQLRKI